MTTPMNFFPGQAWGHVTTMLIYFATWWGLGAVTGYFVGKVLTLRSMARTMRGMMDHIRERVGHEVEHVASATIKVDKAVVLACKALDTKLLSLAIANQHDMPIEDMPDDSLLLPTMHMMRAGHKAFTEAEKEWSRAWLQTNGFKRDGNLATGMWDGPGPQAMKDPTIN